jgi:hypothetical protein
MAATGEVGMRALLSSLGIIQRRRTREPGPLSRRISEFEVLERKKEFCKRQVTMWANDGEDHELKLPLRTTRWQLMLALVKALRREVREDEIVDCETGGTWDGSTHDGMRLALPPPIIMYAREGNEVFELRVSRHAPLIDARFQLTVRRRNQTPYVLTWNRRVLRGDDCQDGITLEIESDAHRVYMQTQQGQEQEQLWTGDQEEEIVPQTRRAQRYIQTHEPQQDLEEWRRRNRIREEPPGLITVQVGTQWIVAHHLTARELREELIMTGRISPRATLAMNGRLLRGTDVLTPGSTIRTNEGLPGGR